MYLILCPLATTWATLNPKLYTNINEALLYFRFFICEVLWDCPHIKVASTSSASPALYTYLS